MNNTAVQAEGLVKSFGDTKALCGIDLHVATGTVVGLLGPNGAGKTTAVRILTTLLRPDGGRATVAGHDVVAHPQRVRAGIGVTGQYAAVDELLTGRENLEMVGQLARLSRADARRRAVELLDRFELADAADRSVKTYSGGMRRRLDLGASLVARPSVLFLDEPTTGLDPRSRLALWAVIRDLVAEGTTLLLTTQYLEEADELADRIVVIDHGRVIAEGTVPDLKDRVGGDVLELTVAPGDDTTAARRALESLGAGDVIEPDGQGRHLRLPVGADRSILAAAVRVVEAAGITIADLSIRRPSLDDVFLALTGHSAEPEADAEAAATNALDGSPR